MIEPCVLEPLRSYPEYPPAGTVERVHEAEAEAEERSFYSGRAPQEWLDALAAGRHLAR